MAEKLGILAVRSFFYNHMDRYRYEKTKDLVGEEMVVLYL